MKISLALILANGIGLGAEMAGAVVTPSVPRASSLKLSPGDLQGEAIQGRAPSFTDPGVQLLIVDFWASWCEPCRESFPHANRLQKKWAMKGVRFLAMSEDVEKAQTLHFLKEVKIEFPVVLDTQRVASKKLEIRGIPTLVFLNSAGEVVDRLEGSTPKSRAGLDQKIAELLKTKP